MTLKSDDLLVLLAVHRNRTYTAAAQHLGVDHTTVARRIHALAQAVGGRLLVGSAGGWELTPLGHELATAAREVEAVIEKVDKRASQTGPQLRGLVRVNAPEVFMHHVVAPAVADVCRDHPQVLCELVSVTRPAPVHGPSADLDIGVTRTRSRRVATSHVLDYRLALYASADYLQRHGPISEHSDLREHVPIYYVESMMQVEDLDRLDELFPSRHGRLGATSVMAQLALVRAGAGIGILPTYFADRYDLRPVLQGSAELKLAYWMTARPVNLRRPEVQAMAQRIQARATSAAAM